MLVQYDGYVTKKVNCFKVAEMATDLMIGDCVQGDNTYTYIDAEPYTKKVKHYYVMECGGNIIMLAPNVKVKMTEGNYALPEEIKKGDKLYNRLVVQYIGHAEQPLYMTNLKCSSIVINGVYLHE